MKNYILFSTNDSRAIDNVSFVIETSMDRNEAIEMIANACKYSNFTVSPVGTPLSATVFDMEHALEVIKSLRLHKLEFVKKNNVSFDVPEFSEELVANSRFYTEDGKVIVALTTTYKSEDPDVMEKEFHLIKELRFMFTGHIAYYKSRGAFVVQDYVEKRPRGNGDTTWKKTHKYTICDGHIIDVMQLYVATEVEI